VRLERGREAKPAGAHGYGAELERQSRDKLKNAAVVDDLAAAGWILDSLPAKPPA